MKRIINVSFVAGVSALAFSLSASTMQAENDDELRSKDVGKQVAGRGDVRRLPRPLKQRLVDLAKRPHSYLPLTAFSEAATPSQLFQYYLLDTTEFQPNIFTSVVPGINDTAISTAANAANGGQRTIGSVRVVLEPKAGKPTDPNDVRAAIDVFTDISGLFVINNESGWYEGWMIRDMRVPRIAPPRADGSAQYFTMTPEDAAAIAAMGAHNNVPGQIYTGDGNDVRFPVPVTIGRTSRPTPSRSPSASARSMPNSKATFTPTGSSIPAPTGFSRTTNCPSPAACPAPSRAVCNTASNP